MATRACRRPAGSQPFARATPRAGSIAPARRPPPTRQRAGRPLRSVARRGGAFGPSPDARRGYGGRQMRPRPRPPKLDEPGGLAEALHGAPRGRSRRLLSVGAAPRGRGAEMPPTTPASSGRPPPWRAAPLPLLDVMHHDHTPRASGRGGRCGPGRRGPPGAPAGRGRRRSISRQPGDNALPPVARGGAFGAVIGTDLGAGRSLLAEYGATGLTLVTVAGGAGRRVTSRPGRLSARAPPPRAGC